MTQHDPDVQALIEALRRIANLENVGITKTSGDFEHQKIAKAALAKLEPKPEKVYVIPSWNDFFESHKNTSRICLTKSEYEQVRELTATDAPAQKWNMPTLQQIKEICGQSYGTTPTNLLDTWYEALRNKIMAMND